MKKLAILALALVLSLSSITGCGLNLDSTTQNAVAFLGEEGYTLNEVKVYVYVLQYAVEKDNANVMSSHFGSITNYWAYMWNDSVANALSNLYQTKVLVKEAEKAGVTLTVAEEAKALAAYADFVNEAGNTFAQYSNLSANDPLVKQYFLENALVNKYYKQIVADIDTKIEDDDSVRGKVFALLYVAPKTNKPVVKPSTESSSETASTSASASASASATATGEPYSKVEMEKNRDEALEEAWKMVQSGKTYDEVVEHFKDSTTVTVSTYSKMTATQSLIKEGKYKYIEEAWTMKTGEERCVVLENSVGDEVGYIMKMTNDDDPDQRASLTEKVYEERRAEVFNEYFIGLRDGAYKDFTVKTAKLANLTYKGNYFALTTTSTEAAESGSATGTGSATGSASATATEAASK